MQPEGWWHRLECALAAYQDLGCQELAWQTSACYPRSASTSGKWKGRAELSGNRCAHRRHRGDAHDRAVSTISRNIR